MAITINNSEELAPLSEMIQRSAKATTDDLAVLLKQTEGVLFFRKLRFENIGRDPLNLSRPLNFVEQLNQTTSHLAVLKATSFLLEHHIDSAPFTLNLGPKSGYDVYSKNGKVVAEVFAAVTPESNNKLKEDIKKVRRSGAEHKYVFYYCPGFPKQVVQVDGVTTISLGDI